MVDERQRSTGSFAEETPRRDAVRAMGAAGAALLGALGMGAISAEAKSKKSGKQVGSEKKGKKGKKGKRGPAGPAGPAGPQGPAGQNAGTLYWASVDSDGTFIAGHGFVRAHNIGGKTGLYSVSTEHDDVSFASCAVIGMGNDGNRIVLGTITSPGPVTLRTQQFDNEVSMFVTADSAFSLIAICPAE